MTTMDAMAMDQALESVADTWVALRDALTGATAMEALVLLPLIERATRLRLDITALMDARKADA